MMMVEVLVGLSQNAISCGNPFTPCSLLYAMLLCPERRARKGCALHEAFALSLR